MRLVKKTTGIGGVDKSLLHVVGVPEKFNQKTCEFIKEEVGVIVDRMLPSLPEKHKTEAIRKISKSTVPFTDKNIALKPQIFRKVLWGLGLSLAGAAETALGKPLLSGGGLGFGGYLFYDAITEYKSFKRDYQQHAGTTTFDGVTYIHPGMNDVMTRNSIDHESIHRLRNMGLLEIGMGITEAVAELRAKECPNIESSGFGCGREIYRQRNRWEWDVYRQRNNAGKVERELIEELIEEFDGQESDLQRGDYEAEWTWEYGRKLAGIAFEAGIEIARKKGEITVDDSPYFLKEPSDKSIPLEYAWEYIRQRAQGKTPAEAEEAVWDYSIERK